MNIREGTRDLMVRLEGPVVRPLLDVFRRDWTWTTGEPLHGEAWRAVRAAAGSSEARVIPDGPDGDLDNARLTFISGLAAAQRSVRIVTPYFLPDTMLISALHAAALRGVEIDVLIPAESNLPYLTWATRAELPYVLAHGCRVVGAAALRPHQAHGGGRGVGAGGLRQLGRAQPAAQLRAAGGDLRR